MVTAMAASEICVAAMAAVHRVSPDKFDNAVLLKICSDGTRVLRLTDGTVWADDYRVEDWRTVC
jgi:hypothetical protein